MTIKNQLEDESGRPIPFTCKNRRFKTNTEIGKSHGSCPIRGSVFDEPLIEHDGESLWLEHVIEHNTNQPYYWLMWYRDGVPTIPLSGIFDRAEFSRMIGRLVQFVP